MADKDKSTKDAASKDSAKSVPATELRDLDLLDEKVDKVKGGLGSRRRKMPRT